MAKKVGLISINLVSGTAEFNTQMDKAKAKLASIGSASQAAGHATVSSMQASSAAIRVMEGGVTNNLRAVERFVAGTLGLGPAMKAIFPVVGALAFGGLIFEIGEKVYNFFKKTQENAIRTANAFRELNAPIRLSNDELKVTNDRLANDIAKLEGKHQNNLALALDEARASADKLADSLDRDLNSLNKVLKEQEISKWGGFMSIFVSGHTQASTTDFAKKVGGATGSGGFAGEIDKLTDDYRAKLDKPGLTVKDANVIRAAARKALDDKLAAIVKEVSKDLDTTQMNANASAGGQNYQTLIEFQEYTKRHFAEMQRSVPLSFANVDLTTRRDADIAANANSKRERPLQDKLKALDAQLTEAASKLAGAGKSQATQELMKADAEAVKAIEEVNKALEHEHTKLDAAGEAAIRLREKSIVLVTAEADWKTKLAATESEMGDRIRSQQLLTDAIGKGYEATKRANAETAVMSFAKEKYDDPIWMSDHAADISKVRAGAGDEFDAKHKEQVATAVDGLTHQIELEKSLAAVQSRGAEAVRLVALAYKLAELARKGNNAEAAKEIELYNSQRANVSAEHIAGITREIDATRRLSAAQIEGAEALRRAELEVKYAQMTHDQVPAQEIAATRLEDELKHQQAVTAEVLKTVNAGRDRLAEIDQEEAAAKALVGSAADQLGIMIKLRELENERLEILARQAIKVGTLQGGLRAFFLDMEKEAEKPGKILLDGMNEAVSGISNNLTKLLTGQKAAWAQMFKSIGNQMLEASIKSGLQTGLGALGKKLGIAPRLDGQSPATAPWVRIAPDATPKRPACPVPAAARRRRTFSGVSESGTDRRHRPLTLSPQAAAVAAEAPWPAWRACSAVEGVERPQAAVLPRPSRSRSPTWRAAATSPPTSPISSGTMALNS